MSFNFDYIQGENQLKASTDRDWSVIYGWCDKSHSVLNNHTKIDYRGKTISERDHTETMTNNLF